MKLRAAKWLAMSLVTLSAFAFASAATEAEACCGLFQCLFGWCGGCRSQCSPCGPAMGNCGPSGCSTGSYYGPVVYRGCAPCASSCAPCASSCSPCGIASAGCASGDCSLGSSSTTMPPAPTPEPNDNWDRKKQKKTFADPDADLGPNGRPAGSGSQLNKEDDSAFKKARTEEAEATDEQGSLSPASKKSDSASSKASRKGPPPPKADVKEDPDSSRAPTISVDEKVAWRDAPARTRVETRPRTVSARIVRLPAYPKSDWLPVEGESKVAKK
jgi:hypothetical protein